MNWTAISAIADILAATGVIISLVYLAVQIRNQNKESRIAVIHSLTQQWADIMARMVDEGNNAVWRRGLDSFNELNDIERGRHSAMMLNITQVFEGLYLQRADGKLDSQVWIGIDARVRDIFSNPGTREWWEVRAHWYSPKFRSYIATILSETEGKNSYAKFFNRESPSETETAVDSNSDPVVGPH